LTFFYRNLIRAYPREFRQRYGEDLVELFRDQLDDAIKERRVFRMCVRTLLDWMATVGEHRGEIVVALILVILGIAATKHPAIDIPVGLSLAWPYSLAAGVAYRVLLDACIAVMVLLAARAPRNIGLALLLVPVGRIAYFLLSATISQLPAEGPAYTARHMLQWVPLIAATLINVGRWRNNEAAIR
jgi:hypothetical protein